MRGQNLPSMAFDALAHGEYYTEFSQHLPNNRNAIVVYHAVGEPELFGNVSSRRFEADLRYLDARYEIVDLPELFRQPTEGPKRIAVTFDDAYRNFYEYAYPVIRSLEVPVTLFVPTAFVGGVPPHLAYRLFESPSSTAEYNDPETFCDEPHSAPAILTRDQLAELAESDFVMLGNHSQTHPDLSRIHDSETLEKEILASRWWFEDQLDISVDRYCFPYGRYNDRALSLIKESHSLAVTTEQGLLDVDCSVCELPRVPGHVSSVLFRWLLTDTNWFLTENFAKLTA